jgi:transcriptional regulator with XRE-family HTH domain
MSLPPICSPPEIPALASEPSVGALLRWARVQRGLSARALSMQAGLSDSAAGKVETAAVDPSLGTFARLVCELGLNDHEIAVLVRLAALRTR